MMKYKIDVAYKVGKATAVEHGHLVGYCVGEYNGLYQAWQRMAGFVKTCGMYAIVGVEITVPYIGDEGK